MRTCAVQCCADLDCRIFIQPRLSFRMVLLFLVSDTLSTLHSMGSRRLHGALWRCFLAQIDSSPLSVASDSQPRYAFFRHLAAANMMPEVPTIKAHSMVSRRASWAHS